MGRHVRSVAGGPDGFRFLTSSAGRYAVFTSSCLSTAVGYSPPRALRLFDAATTTDDLAVAAGAAQRASGMMHGRPHLVWLVDFEAGTATPK